MLYHMLSYLHDQIFRQLSAKNLDGVVVVPPATHTLAVAAAADRRSSMPYRPRLPFVGLKRDGHVFTHSWP